MQDLEQMLKNIAILLKNIFQKIKKNHKFNKNLYQLLKHKKKCKLNLIKSVPRFMHHMLQKN